VSILTLHFLQRKILIQQGSYGQTLIKLKPDRPQNKTQQHFKVCKIYARLEALVWGFGSEFETQEETESAHSTSTIFVADLYQVPKGIWSATGIRYLLIRFKNPTKPGIAFQDFRLYCVYFSTKTIVVIVERIARVLHHFLFACAVKW
jgi:hypothetical protein